MADTARAAVAFEQHSWVPAPELAAELGVARRTLARWLRDGALGFPRPKIVNHRLYFERSASRCGKTRPQSKWREALEPCPKQSKPGALVARPGSEKCRLPGSTIPKIAIPKNFRNGLSVRDSTSVFAAMSRPFTGWGRSCWRACSRLKLNCSFFTRHHRHNVVTHSMIKRAREKKGGAVGFQCFQCDQCRQPVLSWPFRYGSSAAGKAQPTQSRPVNNFQWRRASPGRCVSRGALYSAVTWNSRGLKYPNGTRVERWTTVVLVLLGVV
jgi:hypothetical protein